MSSGTDKATGVPLGDYPTIRKSSSNIKMLSQASGFSSETPSKSSCSCLTPTTQGSLLFHWLCWYKCLWGHTVNWITVRQNWLPINCQNEYLENLHAGKPRNCNGKTSQRIHRPSLISLFKTLLPDLIWIRNSTLHLCCNGFLDLCCKGLEDSKNRTAVCGDRCHFSPLSFSCFQGIFSIPLI